MLLQPVIGPDTKHCYHSGRCCIYNSRNVSSSCRILYHSKVEPKNWTSQIPGYRTSTMFPLQGKQVRWSVSHYKFFSNSDNSFLWNTDNQHHNVFKLFLEL